MTTMRSPITLRRPNLKPAAHPSLAQLVAVSQ